MLLNPKTPLVFGIVATAALAGYLFVRDPIPGSLSLAHARVIPETDIHSCKQCHAPEGLTAGCLTCHTEIAGQLDANEGYHAFLAQDQTFRCAACHLEHHGEAFPLVSTLSWPDGDPNAFDHPQCAYELSGRHDELTCAECHEDKLTKRFALPDFPQWPRTSTFLGLTQDCLACHVDVHAWPSERACLDCHDQTAFDPAPLFHHDDVFVLEGEHAKTDCAGCHQTPDGDHQQSDASQRTPGMLPYYKVAGETCEACHPNPHRTVWSMDCQGCHLGRDAEWREGTRGMNVETHAPTGFDLTGDHVAVACAECHPEDLNYAMRYPDPNSDNYQRQLTNCEGCHEDVHAAAMDTACVTCHTTGGWKGENLLFDHNRDTTFALDAAHGGLACQECHAADDLTYRADGTECQACHQVEADALRGQAQQLQIEPDPHFERVACTDCHDMSVARQSMASHAQRCADCHNDQYAQLAYDWERSFQRRRSAIERLVEQRADAPANEVATDLSEAAQCGLHHLHLTQQLYDRILERLKAEESEEPTPPEENATWTGL